MQKQNAGDAHLESSSALVTTSRRSILIGAFFFALLITSLFAQNATASSPSQAQDTIPPNTDSFAVGLFLPQIVTRVSDVDDKDDDVVVSVCPTESNAVYASLPVAGPRADHPAEIHADLNLALRSYMTVTMPLSLVDINGPTDPDAPQFANITGAGRPEFVAAYQVNQWDWGCTGDVGEPWHGRGCRGAPITYPPVTLLGFATEKGSPVRTPSRNAEIHAGNFVALVLYAEETRVTLVYTREDTAARGYVIHLENICVDPALLLLYRQLDARGRSSLPALHSLEPLGTGADTPLKAAIRDTGSFMDPRSRKDWWYGH